MSLFSDTLHILGGILEEAALVVSVLISNYKFRMHTLLRAEGTETEGSITSSSFPF